jgi:alkylated DNA repair dioxygenase AlkB
VNSEPQLFENPLEGPGLDVRLLRGFLPHTEADVCFEELLRTTTWRQYELTMFGRKVQAPRLENWIGDEGAVYTYSALTLRPDPWTPTLRDLAQRAAEVSGVEFNSVLLNRYRDGGDGVAWHADDEPELGRQPVIFSLSLGASRPFQLRSTSDPTQRRSIDLHHGDALIMHGRTQALWRHRIPRTSASIGERINLTFRLVRPRPGS